MKRPAGYRRRSGMILQIIKVLAIIGVLLPLMRCENTPFATAEQAAEITRRNKHKHTLSEQFVRSLSKGSNGINGRGLKLQKVETKTRRITDETELTPRLTRKTQHTKKQRTMQRRNGRFGGQRRNGRQGSNGGGRGGGRNGKWKPADWSGSSRGGSNGKWKPSGWNSNGGGSKWSNRKSHKYETSWKAPPNPAGWGSSWGQGWGGGGHKPAPSPTKPDKTPYPTYYEPPPTTKPPKPSPEPTPKPTINWFPWNTPEPTKEVGDMRLIQVTMDGMLTAINLDVPQEGSQDLTTLATAFEMTISEILGKEYRVNVYEIGGIPVDSDDEEDKSGSNGGQGSSRAPPREDNKNEKGTSKRKKRKGMHRNLQSWNEWDTELWEQNVETTWGPGLEECPLDDGQIPVLFELQVIAPCFDCDEEKAIARGLEIYRETFAALDDAVKSGRMSTVFCMNAMNLGLMNYPCGGIEITCVMGISFRVQFVDQITTPQPTSQPTDTPTVALPDPTSYPTRYPTRYPTVYPTLNPTLFPTLSPTEDFLPTLYPTLSPTESDIIFDLPTLDPTLLPTELEPTAEPTLLLEPTPEPTIPIEPTPEPTIPIEPTPEPTIPIEPTPEPTVLVDTPIPTVGTVPTYEPTPFPTEIDENPTFQPTATDGSPLFIFGSSESVGNPEIFDYEVPFDVGEDVLFASAGTQYTLVILDDESAAVAGYIDNIIDYSGYFGLPPQDLFEGSNELAVIDSIVNLDDELRSAPRFRRVYAGVKTQDNRMHSAFIDVDGNVYASGSNNFGQLCIGDLDDRFIPHQIDIGEEAVSVAVGGDFTLILGASGDVYGCGSNEVGQLGLGNTLFADLPDSRNRLRNVKSISAGLDFALLRSEDGLVVMGSNANEQFCTDEFFEVDEPYIFDFLDVDPADIRQFRAGIQSSYILFRDGSVAACGLNNYGQLGIGEFDDVGPATVEIPDNNFIRNIGVGPSAVSAFFVASDGVVYGAGRNDRGQLGVGDRRNSETPEEVLFNFNGDEVSRVSAAFDHTLAW